MQFIKKHRASVIIDGSFGSTGKGAAAAYIAENETYNDWASVICTTNAAPNAGHTSVLKDGRKFVTFHMPTIAVIHPETSIYLNAGAIIDPAGLIKEMEQLDIDPARVTIHPNAAIIQKADTDAEKDLGSSVSSIASTQKGVGSALANKIMRRADTASHCLELNDTGIKIGKVDLNEALRDKAVSIEVPQGMALSLDHGFYPHVTSRDVSVSYALACTGLHPSALGCTMMTTRTFPIRVGNLYDKDGMMVGPSGPFYPDQTELDWSHFPGVEPERTTVTQRVRRIATWSDLMYREAMGRLRPTHVWLSFCDYATREEMDAILCSMRDAEEFYNMKVSHLYAYGPSTKDVYPNPQPWWYKK